jgi:hypothetical protein
METMAISTLSGCRENAIDLKAVKTFTHCLCVHGQLSEAEMNRALPLLKTQRTLNHS